MFIHFIFSGPEITDELLKVLRKRLDETTLDIITVMLVRNCKLTPADVEVNCSWTHFCRKKLKHQKNTFLFLVASL